MNLIVQVKGLTNHKRGFYNASNENTVFLIKVISRKCLYQIKCIRVALKTSNCFMFAS